MKKWKEEERHGHQEPKIKEGYVARYATMVTSGNRGAILEL